MLIFPNKLSFTLGGGQVETYEHCKWKKNII